jgi:MFS family permease
MGRRVHVLPGLIITGLGMGCIVAPAFSTATLGVQGNEAGIASAMVNTSQQIGGSVGTSLLSTLFAGAVASFTASHLDTTGVAASAAIHGYTTAFWWATGMFALGFLLALVILPGRAKPRAHTLSTALARHAIANCHHVDLEGAAR